MGRKKEREKKLRRTVKGGKEEDRNIELVKRQRRKLPRDGKKEKREKQEKYEENKVEDR